METKESPNWYTDAEKYWDTIPATINGMLGGLGQLARPDAVSSLRFLSEFVTPPATSSASSIVNPLASNKDAKAIPTATQTGSPTKSTNRQKLPLPNSGPSHVLDCGAGIGRVTKQVLIKAFDHVDLVENSAIFVKQAREEYLKAELESGKVCEVRCSGLQNVEFEGTSWEGRFDVIWCQWVLGHLTEEDLISFFDRCKKGLKPGGMIFVKENNAKIGIVIDEEDSSMTRSDEVWKEMFAKAGLKLLRDEVQKGFPSGLFAVKMYALEPIP
ncbi:MAG: AdoMet dependent proline di-methyltransferase-domain-containing protein [Linnemannia gamsii]|nr:MAG: AdoMet dependent proline di-methyltransferase-domain-containing protein [Linnemannia gamsii]